VVVSDTSDPMSHVLDESSHSFWIISMESPDPFDNTFPTDESILEVMSLEETPWDDSHHHSFLFLEPKTIETHPDTLVLPKIFTNSHHDVLFEGNLGNISSTIPIDISIKLGITENIHIGDVLLMKCKLTQPYSNNYAIYFLGITKKCMELT
jgi:hypothetical protein